MYHRPHPELEDLKRNPAAANRLLLLDHIDTLSPFADLLE
jgi:hypothetical protein